MNKDLKKIAAALREQGFETLVSSKGHLIVMRDGRTVVVFAGSPSDWRAMKNGIARARRAGFVWPPRR